MTRRAELGWDVYSDNGFKQASCKYLLQALKLVNTGQTVRRANGRIVWREGKEEIKASENLGLAMNIICQRRREKS